ncbi:hypothetical protein Nepgr_000738 [Nepenthes gracilis]|uniref:LysM domain-containing protein n=1 Tax=Nepenthes gracilis TaxID=150966 RepID=A0AAD3P6Y4_NEPGR|nr:hypothetical protein Nepgr_000738 [Nepenthes gracilis]
MGSERLNGGHVEYCIGQDTGRVIGNRGCNHNDSPAMPCKVFPVPSSPFASSSSSSPVGFIEHPVSKMDTLAGIAIKYGVEVADVKRMNGLVTDRQMFALKTLQIPLPGRHPPSSCLSNGSNSAGRSISEQTPPRCRSDLFEQFQSLRLTPERKVSPAMSSLQGYYGLKPTDNSNLTEEFEMTVYSKGTARYLGDTPFPKPSPATKSRSLANGLVVEQGGPGNDPDMWIDKLVTRHQKSEADFSHRTPEKLLEENGSSGSFSAIAGKGLALRAKAASRTNLSSEAEGGGMNADSSSPGDSVGADSLSGVRKSSSTSSLQDPENSSSSSIRPASKWSLKPDLQALSTTAIAKPIFDGLPKPISGWKNKAALD